MYDICCIGHITLDKVITSQSVVYMPGGTSFYFSSAIRDMQLKYKLITSLAETEMHFVDELRATGIEVEVASFSAHTVHFENNYAEDQDHRTQRVLSKSDAFTVGQLEPVRAALFHLGPLLADDIPVEVIRALHKKGKISLDVQGYLRRVENKKVFSVDWPEKKEALPYVHILKANESEMVVLTQCTDVRKACILLQGWGVQEVVITLGSRGSVVYDGKRFFYIPAFSPVTTVVDATGCGDTYMAGYLYQRLKGRSCQQAGEFAAAMATLKIESSGPFTGTQKQVQALLKNARERAVFGM